MTCHILLNTGPMASILVSANFKPLSLVANSEPPDWSLARRFNRLRQFPSPMPFQHLTNVVRSYRRPLIGASAGLRRLSREVSLEVHNRPKIATIEPHPLVAALDGRFQSGSLSSQKKLYFLFDAAYISPNDFIFSLSPW